MNETEKGFNAALKESKKLLDDAQEVALKATASDVLKIHKKEIKALAKAVKTIASDPKLKKEVGLSSRKPRQRNLIQSFALSSSPF